jgi:hypothetical protein
MIQDYKNYRQIKKTMKMVNGKLNSKFQSMLQPIGLYELHRYELEVGLLRLHINVLNTTYGITEATKYLSEKGPLVFLPSCFCYVSGANFLKPKGSIQRVAVLGFAKKEHIECTENNAIRCVHNIESGIIREDLCANCPKDTFKNLVEYHSLKAEKQAVLQQEKNAKQKLLSYFQFWKRK